MDYTPVRTLRLGIWGDIKTAKTSLAMTFPKPIFHADLDQGFHRVSNRLGGLNVLEWNNLDPQKMLADKVASTQYRYDIYSKAYQQPMPWPGIKIVGIEAIWNEVVQDILTAYQVPDFQTVVIDTGSIAWQLSTGAHLERLQGINPSREKLLPIEYGRPNLEMRALYGGAQTSGKNLAIVHHMAGKYEIQNIGGQLKEIEVGKTWKGFKEMGAMVDVVGQTLIQNDDNPNLPRIPSIYIWTCGLTLGMERQYIDNPTYKMLLSQINDIREGELKESLNV